MYIEYMIQYILRRASHTTCTSSTVATKSPEPRVAFIVKNGFFFPGLLAITTYCRVKTPRRYCTYLYSLKPQNAILFVVLLGITFCGLVYAIDDM